MRSSLLREDNHLFSNAPEDWCNTLIIDLSDKFGGANTRVISLMKKIDREHVALAALENSPVAIEATRAGLRVFTVARHKTSFRIIPSLISIIRRERIQVLDTQNPQSKFWGSIVSMITGTALISTLNSWYASEHGEKSLKGRLYAMLELGTNFALDRYVVVSKAIYDALTRHGVSPQKIDLIHNAVEINHSKTSDSGKSSTYALNLPAESIVLMAAGRLTWAKGYEDLINALEIIVKEDQRVYCLIAGEGELRQSLEVQIRNSGLTKHIFLLGYLPRTDVLSLMEISDIFVMPSRSEGTPIALLEAAALRMPILATSVGGIPELLKNGEECILVSSGDLIELADAIRKLIQDRALADRLAENAYWRVSQDFTVNAQVLATIQSYNKAWTSRKEKLWNTA
ncbi:MAG TPA: glycosyltransferase family 4 protein [Anaerolineales bacterium]|nr:glycosyltransferase family 4 protein [Anaerolineales bacterium]